GARMETSRDANELESRGNRAIFVDLDLHDDRIQGTVEDDPKRLLKRPHERDRDFPHAFDVVTESVADFRALGSYQDRGFGRSFSHCGSRSPDGSPTKAD